MILSRAAAGAVVALFVAPGLTQAAESHATSAPVVRAPAGAVEGQADGVIRIFKGVPYAQAPVGAGRWAPPKPVVKWAGVRNAKAFGPACIQPPSAPGNLYADAPDQMSEDCLLLNIWTPKAAKAAPVFVWIHGGSLRSGASSESMFNGIKMARQGLIVVSINYRLGVLGYLAHPELSREQPSGVSGNYGLLDQIEALRWVRDNIAAFGGDPKNVTIAGESAGGLSVMYLLAAPDAKGLFAKAIAESAYMISTPELKAARFGAPSAEASGVTLASRLKVSGIAELRAMDPRALTDAAGKAGFAPFGAVDGKVLPRQLVETFDRGEQAHVPLLVGFNSGEIRSLRMLAPHTPADAATYEKTIKARYADLAPAFLKLYPSTDMNESVLAATRDGMYGWTAERLAAKQTALGIPAYLYLFDHGYPAADQAGLHGFHASELPYVFGTLDQVSVNWPKPPLGPAEARLSDAMTAYWVSFARSGTPAAVGQPAWRPYGKDAAYMAFKATPQPSTHPTPGAYVLQEQVVCRRRVAGGLAWNWNVGLASPPLPAKVASCG